MFFCVFFEMGGIVRMCRVMSCWYTVVYEFLVCSELLVLGDGGGLGAAEAAEEVG